MDPNYSLQDAIRCKLCESADPQLHCEICHINLCKACAGEHLVDESRFHLVVLFKHRPSISTYSNPKCAEHNTKICELHCDQCNIPICVQCVSSKEHKNHDVVDIVKFIENKKTALQEDLEELGEFIYPKYQDIVSSFLVQKANLNRNTEKLIADFTNRGEVLHSKIDNIIRKLKSDVQAMESKYLAELHQQEGEIKQSILKITHRIGQIKKLLDSNDVYLLSRYKSRNAEFKRFPSRRVLPLPTFSSRKISTDQLLEQFGILYYPPERMVFSSDESELDDSLDH